MTSRFRSATPPPGQACQCAHLPKEPRPKSLMESLLVAKMEQVTLGQSAPKPPLIRTDSVDSNSSVGSGNSLGAGDICRCDDCLLGIADLYAQPVEERKKKVNFPAIMDKQNITLVTGQHQLHYITRANVNINLLISRKPDMPPINGTFQAHPVCEMIWVRLASMLNHNLISRLGGYRFASVAVTGR